MPLRAARAGPGAAPCGLRAVYPPGAPQGAAKAKRGKSACERIAYPGAIPDYRTTQGHRVLRVRYNVGYTHFPWSMHLEQTVARVGRDPGARRTTDARISSVSRVRRTVSVRNTLRTSMSVVVCVLGCPYRRPAAYAHSGVGPLHAHHLHAHPLHAHPPVLIVHAHRRCHQASSGPWSSHAQVRNHRYQ